MDYPLDFQIGQIIDSDCGHFRNERLIAIGGMGALYEWTRLERNGAKVFAAKVVRADLRANAEVLNRFELEAHTVCKLKHPHIIEIEGIFWTRTTPSIPFILMDLLQGHSLRDVMEAEDLTITDTVNIAIALLKAFEALHPRIIHRDVKPDNIFIMTGGKGIKLLDFGIVKNAFQQQPQRGNTGRIHIGSPGYSAPEQLQGDEVTPRTDLYALSVVLYELLTGETMFPGVEDTKALARLHLKTVPEHLSKRVPEVPTDIAEMIMRGLSKDPSARPANAREYLTPFHAFKRRQVEAAIANDAGNSTLEGLIHPTVGVASQVAIVRERSTSLDGKGGTVRMTAHSSESIDGPTDPSASPCGGGTMPDAEIVSIDGPRPHVSAAWHVAPNVDLVASPVKRSAGYAGHIVGDPSANVAFPRGPSEGAVVSPVPGSEAMPSQRRFSRRFIGTVLATGVATLVLGVFAVRSVHGNNSNTQPVTESTPQAARTQDAKPSVKVLPDTHVGADVPPTAQTPSPQTIADVVREAAPAPAPKESTPAPAPVPITPKRKPLGHSSGNQGPAKPSPAASVSDADFLLDVQARDAVKAPPKPHARVGD